MHGLFLYMLKDLCEQHSVAGLLYLLSGWMNNCLCCFNAPVNLAVRVVMLRLCHLSYVHAARESPPELHGRVAACAVLLVGQRRRAPLASVARLERSVAQEKALVRSQRQLALHGVRWKPWCSSDVDTHPAQLGAVQVVGIPKTHN